MTISAASLTTSAKTREEFDNQLESISKPGLLNRYLIVREKNGSVILEQTNFLMALCNKISGLWGSDSTNETLVEFATIAFLDNNKKWISEDANINKSVQNEQIKQLAERSGLNQPNIGTRLKKAFGRITPEQAVDLTSKQHESLAAIYKEALNPSPSTPTDNSNLSNNEKLKFYAAHEKELDHFDNIVGIMKNSQTPPPTFPKPEEEQIAESPPTLPKPEEKQIAESPPTIIHNPDVVTEIRNTAKSAIVPSESTLPTAKPLIAPIDVSPDNSSKFAKKRLGNILDHLQKSGNASSVSPEKNLPFVSSQPEKHLPTTHDSILVKPEAPSSNLPPVVDSSAAESEAMKPSLSPSPVVQNHIADEGSNSPIPEMVPFIVSALPSQSFQEPQNPLEVIIDEPQAFSNLEVSVLPDAVDKSQNANLLSNTPPESSSLPISVAIPSTANTQLEEAQQTTEQPLSTPKSLNQTETDSLTTETQIKPKREAPIKRNLVYMVAVGVLATLTAGGLAKYFSGGQTLPPKVEGEPPPKTQPIAESVSSLTVVPVTPPFTAANWSNFSFPMNLDKSTIPSNECPSIIVITEPGGELRDLGYVLPNTTNPGQNLTQFSPPPPSLDFVSPDDATVFDDEVTDIIRPNKEIETTEIQLNSSVSFSVQGDNLTLTCSLKDPQYKAFLQEFNSKHDAAPFKQLISNDPLKLEFPIKQLVERAPHYFEQLGQLADRFRNKPLNQDSAKDKQLALVPRDQRNDGQIVSVFETIIYEMINNDFLKTHEVPQLIEGSRKQLDTILFSANHPENMVLVPSNYFDAENQAKSEQNKPYLITGFIFMVGIILLKWMNDEENPRDLNPLPIPLNLRAAERILPAIATTMSSSLPLPESLLPQIQSIKPLSHKKQEELMFIQSTLEQKLTERRQLRGKIGNLLEKIDQKEAKIIALKNKSIPDRLLIKLKENRDDLLKLQVQEITLPQEIETLRLEIDRINEEPDNIELPLEIHPLQEDNLSPIQDSSLPESAELDRPGEYEIKVPANDRTLPFNEESASIAESPENSKQQKLIKENTQALKEMIAAKQAAIGTPNQEDPSSLSLPDAIESIKKMIVEKKANLAGLATEPEVSHKSELESPMSQFGEADRPENKIKVPAEVAYQEDKPVNEHPQFIFQQAPEILTLQQLKKQGELVSMQSNLADKELILKGLPEKIKELEQRIEEGGPPKALQKLNTSLTKFREQKNALTQEIELIREGIRQCSQAKSSQETESGKPDRLENEQALTQMAVSGQRESSEQDLQLGPKTPLGMQVSGDKSPIISSQQILSDKNLEFDLDRNIHQEIREITLLLKRFSPTLNKILNHNSHVPQEEIVNLVRNPPKDVQTFLDQIPNLNNYLEMCAQREDSEAIGLSGEEVKEVNYLRDKLEVKTGALSDLIEKKIIYKAGLSDLWDTVNEQLEVINIDNYNEKLFTKMVSALHIGYDALTQAFDKISAIENNADLKDYLNIKIESFNKIEMKLLETKRKIEHLTESIKDLKLINASSMVYYNLRELVALLRNVPEFRTDQFESVITEFMVNNTEEALAGMSALPTLHQTPIQIPRLASKIEIENLEEVPLKEEYFKMVTNTINQIINEFPGDDKDLQTYYPDIIKTIEEIKQQLQETGEVKETLKQILSLLSNENIGSLDTSLKQENDLSFTQGSGSLVDGSNLEIPSSPLNARPSTLQIPSSPTEEPSSPPEAPSPPGSPPNPPEAPTNPPSAPASPLNASFNPSNTPTKTKKSPPVKNISTSQSQQLSTLLMEQFGKLRRSTATSKPKSEGGLISAALTERIAKIVETTGEVPKEKDEFYDEPTDLNSEKYKKEELEELEKKQAREIVNLENRYKSQLKPANKLEVYQNGERINEKILKCEKKALDKTTKLDNELKELLKVFDEKNNIKNVDEDIEKIPKKVLDERNEIIGIHRKKINDIKAKYKKRLDVLNIPFSRMLKDSSNPVASTTQNDEVIKKNLLTEKKKLKYKHKAEIKKIKLDHELRGLLKDFDEKNRFIPNSRERDKIIDDNQKKIDAMKARYVKRLEALMPLLQISKATPAPEASTPQKDTTSQIITESLKNKKPLEEESDDSSGDEKFD